MKLRRPRRLIESSADIGGILDGVAVIFDRWAAAEAVCADVAWTIEHDPYCSVGCLEDRIEPWRAIAAADDGNLRRLVIELRANRLFKAAGNTEWPWFLETALAEEFRCAARQELS